MLRTALLSLASFLILLSGAPIAQAGETYYGQCDGITDPMRCAELVIEEKGGPQNDHEMALVDFLGRCDARTSTYGGYGPAGDPNDYYTWSCTANDGTYNTNEDPAHYTTTYPSYYPDPRSYEQVSIDESVIPVEDQSDYSYEETYPYDDYYSTVPEYEEPSYEEEGPVEDVKWYEPIIASIFGGLF